MRINVSQFGYSIPARVFACAAMLWAGSQGVAADDPKLIRLATTTSTDNSGLIRAILPEFEKQYGYTIHVIAVGTGKALELGRRGDVDSVLVHDRAAELRFVAEGYGADREDVMYNDFVVVGPPADPAGIGGGRDALESFRAIAAAQALFLSRGDDSGTHRRENRLWAKAGVVRTDAWYREVGQGMGKVLQMASELGAYTITDRGTWLAYRQQLQLKLVVEGDPEIFNPYGIIAVNPQLHPGVNYAGARALADWLISAAGQRAIGEFRVNGEPLFHPNASVLSHK
ncbi:MAG: substrate-binding domain-containing protein [Gammaproteobacteria bacterium]|nr:substrate-binding domain-containing protein [Gammaproteobacteria bacterium]MDH3468371.1 substrate-binding domain-containing protein [Gammaproteobacteria bacterium]